MVKRITVSCPDDIGEKLEAFKEKISPSSIFQEAAKRAIAREERLTKKMEDCPMNAIIERLKGEKQKSFQEFYEMGRREGIDWAKNVHYDDLVAVTNFEPPYENGNMSNFTDWKARKNEESSAVQNILMDFIEEYRQFDSLDHPYLCEEVEDYMRGFLESVKDFWNQVADKL